MKKINEISLVNIEQYTIKALNDIAFEKKSLNLICARPGNCKTLMLLNILDNFAHMYEEKKIIFLSLEMDENRLAQRLKKINEDGYIELLNKNHVKFHADLDLTIEGVENIVDLEEPDILIIDYIQLLSVNQSELATISKKLCKIAIEHNCIIFAASQLNPGFRLDKISDALNYIAGTSQFAKDATNVICIAKSGNNDLWISYPKVRHGNANADKPFQYEIEKTGTINNKTNGKTHHYSEEIMIVVELCNIFYLVSNDIDQWTSSPTDNINEIKPIEFDELHLNLEQRIQQKLLYQLVDLWYSSKQIISINQLTFSSLQNLLAEKYNLETGKEVSFLSPEEFEEFKKWKTKQIITYRKKNIEFLNKNKSQIEDILRYKINKPYVNDAKENKLLTLNDCEILYREIKLHMITDEDEDEE